MNMTQQREEYLTKTIRFGSGTMTLYSLDGQTWSSRPDELTNIKERQEQQRLVLMGKKEEAEEAGEGGISFGSAPKAKDESDDSEVLEADGNEPFVLDDEVEEEITVAPVKKVSSKPVKAAPKIVAAKVSVPSKKNAPTKKTAAVKTKPVAKAKVKPTPKKKASKPAKKKSKK